MSKVIFSNQCFDAEHVRENPGFYATRLQRAKALDRNALCDCSFPRLRLQIRELNRAFYLAVWPKEGPKHKPDCYFYRDEVQQEIDSAAKRSSIIERDDGTTSIKPDFAMSVVTSNPKDPTPNPVKTHSGTSRRRASLLAILIHLWSASGNNRWFGFGMPRNYSSIAWRLWLEMQKITLGNKPMSEVCMLPGIGAQKAKEFLLKLKKPAANSSVQTAMLVGHILSIHKTNFGYKITLNSMSSGVFLSDAIYQNISEKFAFAMQALQSQSGYCVMLAAHFEAKSKKGVDVSYINLIDASLFVTTEDFIPVDSSYERILSDDLVKNKRKFIKPLSVEEGLMPDFILVDTPKPVYLEVWGMNTPEYLKRKIEKQQMYRSRNMQIWEWTARPGSFPPALPFADNHPKSQIY